MGHPNVESTVRSAEQPTTIVTPQELPPCKDAQDHTRVEVPGFYDISCSGGDRDGPRVLLHEPPTCSHVPIPASTDGCLTQAYERALRNRIRETDVGRGGDFDVEQELPVFLHDCLMLPGTLANKLNLTSEDVLDRMTPAILPGFHPHIHTATLEPCLVDSRVLGDYVQGMLLFGQSKDSKSACQQHYGEETKRIKARVELALAAPVQDGLKLERRVVWAYVWMWRTPASTSFEPRGTCPEGWTIEQYVSDTLLQGSNSGLMRSLDRSIGQDYDPDGLEDAEAEGRVQPVGPSEHGRTAAFADW